MYPGVDSGGYIFYPGVDNVSRGLIQGLYFMQGLIVYPGVDSGGYIFYPGVDSGGYILCRG